MLAALQEEASNHIVEESIDRTTNIAKHAGATTKHIEDSKPTCYVDAQKVMVGCWGRRGGGRGMWCRLMAIRHMHPQEGPRPRGNPRPEPRWRRGLRRQDVEASAAGRRRRHSVAFCVYTARNIVARGAGAMPGALRLPMSVGEAAPALRGAQMATPRRRGSRPPTRSTRCAISRGKVKFAALPCRPCCEALLSACCAPPQGGTCTHTPHIDIWRGGNSGRRSPPKWRGRLRFG